MEEGAQLTFKVPPHGIEFTLPSPKIGVESLPVVDPPWMPHFKTNVDEVTVNTIQHVSSVPWPCGDGVLIIQYVKDKNYISGDTKMF